MHKPRKLSPRIQARLEHQYGLKALNEDNLPLAAVFHLHRAVELAPCAKYHANLAVALEQVAVDVETDPTRRRELLEQGVVESLAALRARPNYVGAMVNLTLILERLGRTQEALFWASLVTSLSPRSAEAAWSRAGLLVRREEWVEAADWYARSHRLKPALTAAVHNEVSCLTNCARDAEALYLLHEELRRDPEDPLIWANLGCAYRRLGRNRMALDCYERALELQPGAATAAWGRSLCLLALGWMWEGWEAYEWGLKTGDRKPPRPFTRPRWEGQPLAGKTILIWMEQGLGDHIVWASLLGDLLSPKWYGDGSFLIVECEHRLVQLLSRSFPQIEFLPQSDPPNPRLLRPDIAYQVPAGALPRLLRPNYNSYRRFGSYLAPDPARIGEWRSRLHSIGPGPKVGVCWRSLRYQGIRAIDCMRLSQWGPILSTPGITWINLQPGWLPAELEEVGDRFDARLHTWSDLDLKDHQDELAALISNLDLVVSAFTVTAQMAGALNVPCWVLAHRGSQSWWSLGTDHCPWHPSLRFFYCQALEPWKTPITELAHELAARFPKPQPVGAKTE